MFSQQILTRPLHIHIWFRDKYVLIKIKKLHFWQHSFVPLLFFVYFGFLNQISTGTTLWLLISLSLRYNRLPAHAFYLDLNCSPYCNQHAFLNACNFQHITFHCPALSDSRSRLFPFFNNMGYLPNNSCR